jgi:hypothetical protein
MDFAIATHVKLTQSDRPRTADATALGYALESTLHAAARTLSLAEQRAMRGLERVRTANAVLSELQRGLLQVGELLLAAEGSPPPTLPDDLAALVSGLGELVAAAEAHGLSLGEGASLELEVPVVTEHPEELEHLLLALPDATATLFGADALGDLDLGRPDAIFAARGAVHGRLVEIANTRAALVAVEQRVEAVLRALGNARDHGAGSGAKPAAQLTNGTAVHLRAEILMAASRALRVQANPSTRAVMLLERA